MNEPTSRDAALDLLWSLWSELGVPGPHRRHPNAVMDPEWLLLHTPWLGRTDPRLLDLVFSWSAAHADWISASRLAGLHGRLTPAVQTAAQAFFSELTTVGVRWTRIPPPTVPRRSVRDVRLPMDRVSTWRFRVRALVGVGGRADVLTALMAAPDRWTDAASLVEVGIAKRNIARVLSELADGHVLHARTRGNVREFRIRLPQSLALLTGLTADAFFPCWPALFEWMVLTDELGMLPVDRPVSAKVEIARRKRSLEDLAKVLEFDAPGDGEGAVLSWAIGHARAMADGTSWALGRTASPRVQRAETAGGT